MTCTLLHLWYDYTVITDTECILMNGDRLSVSSEMDCCVSSNGSAFERSGFTVPCIGNNSITGLWKPMYVCMYNIIATTVPLEHVVASHNTFFTCTRTFLLPHNSTPFVLTRTIGKGYLRLCKENSY